MDSYFTIHVSEDGDVYVHQYTPEQMQAELDQEIADGAKTNYLDNLPGPYPIEGDWGGGSATLVIKGHIVVPKTVEKVTRLVVE